MHDDKKKQSFKTIRMDNDAVDELLNRLDEHGSRNISERRRMDRFTYRRHDLAVLIKQPGDNGPRTFLVQPRNLSEGGLSFLHGGFVHVGANCMVQLVSLHGNQRDVRGTVVSCRFVEGKVHEVGVQFCELIEPAEFCVEANRARVLLVEDDPSIARLGEFQLQKLNAEVETADNGKTAVQMAFERIYDVILMDIALPVMDGITAVKELRARGYSGYVVAVTAKTSDENRARCMEAGFDEFLPKPYTRAALARLISAVDQEPLFSSMEVDPSMGNLITQFVDDLTAWVRQLEDALIHQDEKRLISLTRKLKAEGTGYGFEVLTQLASRIENTLLSGARAEQVRSMINELVALCLQVRASSRR